MCGIAGWVGRRLEGAELRLQELCRCLRHRGPDGAGAFESGADGVALGHRRLAILDLTDASAQPMADEATGLVLIYNGELYNFRKLRTELESRGHRFVSTGDVEVVLRAFLEWGRSAFERFCGMFALVLWDPRDRTLWLARDALGMKPLYLWRPPEGGLVFTSEARALLAEPDFDLDLDPVGLSDYLEFGFQLEPRRTIFRGVERLAPGEVVRVRGGSVVERFRHFDCRTLPPAPDADRARPVAAELLELLAAVVDEHLVADVPVGLLLSGGIDSSLIAALASRNRPLTTVSLGFLGSELDERAPARLVAETLGTDHHEWIVGPEEVWSELEQGAAVLDDLFGDWGTLTTRILYRRARQLGLKAVLVGEGADELFGGYPIFRAAAALAPGPWGEFRLYQRYASRRWGAGFLRLRRAFAEVARSGEPTLFETARGFEVERQLPGHYVMKVDKASMAESVEARAPYLDRRVAAFALKVPSRLLLRGPREKALLRDAARLLGRLPEAVLRRSKRGGMIAPEWMLQQTVFRERTRERLLAPGSWAERLGLGGAMARFFKGHRGDRFPRPLSHLDLLAWRLLLLESWDHSLQAERQERLAG